MQERIRIGLLYRDNERGMVKAKRMGVFKRA